jgi:hypothetical protein
MFFASYSKNFWKLYIYITGMLLLQTTMAFIPWKYVSLAALLIQPYERKYMPISDSNGRK